MTFEKWMDEVSKAHVLRDDDVKSTAFIRYDVFGEEYEEEEPKSPQLKKN